MEIPRYLQILWSYKWLLVVGIVAGVVAGVFAGFTLRDGQLVSRAEHTYTASTTVMLDAENSTLLQAVIPGEQVDQTTTATIRQDLSEVAVLYAYLAQSEAMVTRVETAIGPLAKDEQLTAVSRTTQPNGDERFPGRLELPIIDIVGVSDDSARAEAISRTAADEFRAYVLDEQQSELIPTDARVQLTTLKQGGAVEAVAANPAFPIIVTAGGVILGFIALIYIINGIRTRNPKPEREAKPRRRWVSKKKADAVAEAPEGADADEDEDDDGSVADPKDDDPAKDEAPDDASEDDADEDEDGDEDDEKKPAATTTGALSGSGVRARA